MTDSAKRIATLLTVGAVTIGSLIGTALGSAGEATPRTALVVDAAGARDGRALVDPRLVGLDAELRLPRTSEEARTNVRYFEELGYRVIVASDVTEALAAVER